MILSSILMPFIDSHCHLDFPDFEGELDDVVKRAVDSGITHILTICTHLSKFEQVHNVAKRFENVWCSVGIHPHNVEAEQEATTETLVEMSGSPKVVGFGETGLDFFYEHSSREKQEISFRAHIEAARQTGLPIIIHTREAEEDTIRILCDEAAKGSFPGVIHCFSSGQKLAAVAVELGLYISISGIVTFKTAGKLRETIKTVPLKHLLVETDAPYLAPVPMRGKRNEPAYTVFTAQAVAELKAIELSELANATTDNFFSLFAKAGPQVHLPAAVN